jgi:NitT/TauT family transport system substrate-binding protein
MPTTGVPKTLAAAAVLATLTMAGAAAQETTLKFTLGWKTQGSDAPFLVAKEKGYYKAEGLNVTIDQGEGSGATVTRIMGGAYDVGFGDVNAIILNAAARPNEAPVMVYQLWNRPPFTVSAKKTTNIRTPKDLEGKTLGGAQGTPTTRLLEVFARKNGVDLSKIKVTNMAPNLQEPLLVKGEIDGALIFNITGYFNLLQINQDPDKDYSFLSFGDYGLDLYSNGLMVSQKLIKENPKAVAALVRATNKAMIEIGKDRSVAVKALTSFDNLVNPTIEKRRLEYSFSELIISPEQKEIGLGDIKDDRMARAIAIIVEGYQLTRTPAPSEIFSRAFLPPRGEREFVYATN